MSLYDLMDCDNIVDNDVNIIKITNINNTIEPTVNNILYTESIEYLKYSNAYLHDKMIIADTAYKKKYEDLYNEFKKLKLITTTDRYKIEYYIKTNYKLVNSHMELMSKQIVLTEPKKFFKMSVIHNKINFLINIKDATIRGTLFDKAISYIYDNSIDFLTVVRSCKSVNELSDIIIKKRIITSDEMINALFGDQLEQVKMALNNEFTNLKPCKIIYSHDTRTYGYPDFIADNYVLDVKTSKSSVINVKNYLQIIGYAVCAQTKNVCLYDIENGVIYKGTIKNSLYENLLHLFKN